MLTLVAKIRAIARQASEEVQIIQLRNNEDIADIKEHKVVKR